METEGRRPPSPPPNADDAASPSFQEATASSSADPPSDSEIASHASKDQEFQEGIGLSPADLPSDAGFSFNAPEDEGFQEGTASPSPDPLPGAEIASLSPEEEGVQEVAVPSGAVVLSDDLRDKIVKQVEYYFSDENLHTDKFLLKYVKRDKEGFVPIAVIASFRRMKKLVQDLFLVEAALRTSSQLVVSLDGRKVRRLHPLLIAEIKDTKSRTVIVENLPEDYSTDSLQRIFANIGKIVNITIRDPHSTEESAITRKAEMVISNKPHALIEYETVEAAENAVATLNDEKNWRSGMRVELLLKRMGKYGLIQKGHKETFSGKNNDNQTSEMASDGQKLKSDDHHDEKADKEEEEHFAGGKGRRRSRYRSRGRGQLQQNASGQGHGYVPSGSNNGAIKPVPGPTMPDGTRGFTMGRGKPSISEPNQHGG